MSFLSLWTDRQKWCKDRKMYSIILEVGGGGKEVGDTNWEEIVKESEASNVRVSRANETWQV